METLVGFLWTEQMYAPIVSFDYNFDDMEGQSSFVQIGQYNHNDMLFNISSKAYEMWALDISNAFWADKSYTGWTSNVALIASDYPYLAVPDSMWTDVESDLAAQGFVCFDGPYKQLSTCVASANCDDIAGNLADFSLTVLDDQTQYTITI